MFRSIPIQNKICFQREHQKNIELHSQKVKSMKKMIDNNAPPEFEFLKFKPKRDSLPLSRGNEIQRENTILIHKLTTIMNRTHLARAQTQGNLHQSSSMQSTSNAFNQTGSISRMQSPTSQMERMSLNKEHRKKEFVQIVIENQALLRRIKSQKSEYSVKAWNEERAKNERFISNMSEFQYKDFKPNKTFIKLGVWSDQQTPSTATHRSRPKGKLQPLFKKNNENSARILFKSGKKIGSYFYLVEVKVQSGVFSISLENLQVKDNDYTIDMEEEEGMSILKQECKGNVESLVDKIVINERQRKITLKVASDAQNNSQTVTRISAGSKPNYLKVTEERDEEEEQSILNSKIIEQNSRRDSNLPLGHDAKPHDQNYASDNDDDIRQSRDHEQKQLSGNGEEENEQYQHMQEQQQEQSEQQHQTKQQQRIDSDQESGNEYEELNFDDDEENRKDQSVEL